jgi:hypothetical protein
MNRQFHMLVALVGLPLLILLGLIGLGWRPTLIDNRDPFLGPKNDFSPATYNGLVLKHPSNRKLNLGVAWTSDEILFGLPKYHYYVTSAHGIRSCQFLTVSPSGKASF